MKFLFVVCQIATLSSPVLISLWDLKSSFNPHPFSLLLPPNHLRSIQLLLFSLRESALAHKLRERWVFQMCLLQKSFQKQSHFWKMLFWKPDLGVVRLVLKILVVWKVSIPDCCQIGPLLCLNRSSTLFSCFLLVFRFYKNLIVLVVFFSQVLLRSRVLRENGKYIPKQVLIYLLFKVPRFTVEGSRYRNVL